MAYNNGDTFSNPIGIFTKWVFTGNEGISIWPRPGICLYFPLARVHDLYNVLCSP